MSAQTALQKLLYDTLRADAAVMAQIDGVYDDVPPSAFGLNKAYLSFGASDVVDTGSECIESGEYTLQIDCWSRQVGSVHCKSITDAVKKALHDRDLEMQDHALAGISVVLVRVFRDPDGLTTHGVVQVTATIEEIA